MANANCFRVDIINTVLINVLSTKDRSAIVSLGWVGKLKVSFYCLPLSMTNSCCWDLNVDGLTGAMLARPNAMMVEVWWRFWSWGLFKILLRLNFGDLVTVIFIVAASPGPGLVQRVHCNRKMSFKNQSRKNLINSKARVFSPEFKSEIGFDGEKVISDLSSRWI